jgi:glycosyltransferase involved in cell wall biosynthesis
LKMSSKENLLIDVIVRTKNSEELLKRCLQSIINEIPVRQIIIVDGGSTDRTLEIASNFNNVSIYTKPELNLGQATKFAFEMAKTEWVAIIDSDVLLRKGWFEQMKENMYEADAVESCRIDHYVFDTQADCTKMSYARFGQTILKREPVLDMELDLPFGEDAAIKMNFDKQGKKWKKVATYLADHYTKIESSRQTRTGIIFRPTPHVIHIPKKVQTEEGHLARKFGTITKKQAVKRLILPPIYEAYWAFKKNFWFVLAYFRIV